MSTSILRSSLSPRIIVRYSSIRYYSTQKQASEKASQAANKTSSAASEASNTVSEAVNEASNKAKDLANSASRKASNITDEVTKKSPTTSEASQKASDLTNEAQKKTSEAANQASKGASNFTDKASDLASQATRGSPAQSGKSFNARSGAKNHLSSAANEFTATINRKDSAKVVSDIGSDAKSTVSIIAEQAKDIFNKVTGNTTTNDNNSSNMSSSNSDKNVNASGLTPAESRKLPVIQPSKEDEPIMAAIKELYQCKPREATYSIFAENATFHDPLSIAEGLPRIKVQYNALPALFPRSRVDKFDLLESPKTLTNTLLINQDVTYWRSENTNDEPFKKMNSLLTVIKDNNGKVLRLTEEWNHDKVTDGSNGGFLGLLNEGRKKAFAAISMPFVDQTAPMDRK